MNYLQSRPHTAHLNENQPRYFGKELFNCQQELNEHKINNFQTNLNLPLSQRSDLSEQMNGIFLPKRTNATTTHSHNSSFCTGFQAKQLKANIQRQATLKEEKENSHYKSKMQTESTQMITESEEPSFQGQNFLSQNTIVEERAFNIELPGEVYPFDLSIINNPQFAVIYTQEMFDFLKVQETKYAIDKIYISSSQQPDINGKMRGILVDWLVDVHLKFKLKDETLYVTIALIDRYLSIVFQHQLQQIFFKAQTTRQQLQLVGVASLFIACKYEEIYPPDLKDFVYITDNAYTKQEVLDFEGKILLALQFNITQPSSYTFLQRYGRVAGLDKKNLLLAQYLLELALVEIKFIIYKPSMLACAVVYLVHKIRKVTEPWSQSMQNLCQFKETELRPCAKDLCILLQSAEKQSLQAVKKKFCSQKFMEVARIRVEKGK